MDKFYIELYPKADLENEWAKNKHMPGHFGVERVTVQNLEIVKVDEERNLLLIKGAVPGANGGLLLVRNTCKA